MKFTYIFSSILTSIASSLCCIVPLIALIAGGTGTATNLSWLSSYRPYFIVFTIVVLGFAWYQQFKPKKECCSTKKINFMNSKSYLTIISLFAILMMSFPSFSDSFYAKTPTELVLTGDTTQIVLIVEGMTCGSCENHINHALNSAKGIISCTSSAKEGIATILYDDEQMSFKKIKRVINRNTSFKVKGIKE